MTKLILTASVLMLLFLTASAQQTPWQWVNPLPQGNLLNGVWSVTQDTVYAVGEDGTVLKTTNGGNTWQIKNEVAGIVDQLFAVQFVSGTVGWAAGEYGQVIKTTDGGLTWFPQFVPTVSDLYAVYFTSASQGWVGGNGGQIFSTTNGGLSWNPDTTHSGNTIFGIYFRNSTTGWAVGTNGEVLTSTNGGNSWTHQTSGTSQALYSIQFTSATTGMVVGSFGTILKTANAGVTWTPIASPTDLSLYAIQFTSALNGSAVGAYGELVRTTDGGVTWIGLSTPTSNDLYAVRFAPSTGIGIAVGDYGTILGTTDAGATWHPLSNGVKNELYAINFPATDVGYAVGDIGTIVKTSDGGKTWTSEGSGTYQVLWGVYFTDPNTGFAVGDSATVLKTTNGGFSWVEENSHTDPSLYSIYFANQDTGWTVGDFGTILRTVSGGASWLPESSHTFSTLNRVKFATSKIGWAVGYDGTILKTTNAGVKWVQQTSNTIRTLYSIDVLSTTTAYAVGDFGLVLKTTDGGTTWTSLNTNNDASFTGVAFFSPLQGWAVGDDGTVVNTTDGGATWTTQITPTTHTLWEVQLIRTSSHGGLLFATGIGGTIICSAVEPFPVHVWTGSFDSLWTNPGNWSPSGTPSKEDSVFVPATANNPVLRSFTQQLNISALTVGAGAKLTFGSGLSQLLVKNNVTLSGTLLVESNASPKITVGGNLTTVVAGAFFPGKSTVVLTSPGQVKGSFYNLVLTETASMKSIGNISILNNITLLSDLSLRANDTMYILNPDPAAVEGDGFISPGTIKRAIQTGSTDVYRFESPITFLRFYPTGTLPASVQMTVFPNSLPPGQPDSIYIRRYYNIISQGGSNYQSTLSLRYDTAESKFTIDNLALFRDSSGIVFNMGASDYLDSDIVAISLDTVSRFSLWYLGRSDFVPHHPMQFLDSLYLTDHGNITDTLLFGAQPGATDGIDAAFGETQLAPKPPSGFDVRWSIPATNGSLTDIRGLLPPGQIERTYTCTMQAGAGGFPFTLRWNSGLLASGTFFLEDQATQGAQFTVNMKLQSSFVVPTSANSTVLIVHKAPYTYSFSAIWNMISLPVTPTSDGKRATIFPAANSEAFAYASGYVVTPVLTTGAGYWLRFPTAQIVNIDGLPMTKDTVAVTAGWNMIGSISSAVSKNSITQIPANIVGSNYFGYTGSYTVSDSIRPAKAYWVKVRSDGQLILSAGAAAGVARSGVADPADEGLASMNLLTVTDAAGRSQSLYFGRSDQPAYRTDRYELPPVPPPGSLDARFSSGRMVEVVDGPAHRMVLNVRAGSYPVTIAWKLVQTGSPAPTPVSADGNVLSYASDATGGHVIVDDPAIGSIVFRFGEAAAATPRSFALLQNYPNPFNPTTKFEFRIASAGPVTLKVYDLLGQEVATLVNEVKQPGDYRAEWNAAGFPSGVYLYRLQAGSFVDTKKLVLLK